MKNQKNRKHRESQRYSDKVLTHISLESQKEMRKKRAEAMMKNTVSQIQDVLRIPNRINYKKSYTQAHQNTITETQSKEKILRTATRLIIDFTNNESQ